MRDVIDNERFRKLLRAVPATAIKLLYDEYRKSLVRLANYLTQNEQEAEDIVQETFVYIWQNHKKLAKFHQVPISHYLAKIVRNKAMAKYKQARQISRENSLYRNDHADDLAVSGIETNIIRLEMNRELRHLIATFPSRESECLLMRMDEELTVEQIAGRLGVTKKAVERSLTSANKRLRRQLSGK